jgi:hypothetical protein
MVPAYCSEQCAQKHWKQSHERECIGAGPFDMFALPTMGKEYFFEQTKYMTIKELCWAIAIAKPEAQDKILGWLSGYDDVLLRKIILLTATDVELLPFFKKLITDYDKYRPWSSAGVSRRNVTYTIAKFAIKYCNVTAFKWLLENSHVIVDDAMLIDIIKKWPECAKNGAGSIEFVVKDYTKGHDPKAHIMKFLAKNNLETVVFVYFLEQMIYYGIKEDYLYDMVPFIAAEVTLLLKSYQECKKIYKLPYGYNGFKIIDYLLKNASCFQVYSFWPDYFVDLIMKYSHFKGEAFEIDDTWNNVWEHFVKHKTGGYLLERLLLHDLFRTNVSTIFLWKILIHIQNTGMSLSIMEDDEMGLSFRFAIRVDELINTKIQQPNELEKLVRYAASVELRPAYIELLCGIVSKANCSKMIQKIIDWFLPREHKLRNILQLPKIVNRNMTEFDVMDPPPRKYSVDTLRATLISFYTYELLETQEGKTYQVDFSKDDEVMWNVLEGSSNLRVRLVPNYSPPDNMVDLIEESADLYGIFVIEKLLQRGYKFTGLYIIDENYDKTLHQKSESIKRKVY